MKQPKLIKSVLIVEDDPTYLHLWERLLRDTGIKKCRVIGNAKEAATFLARHKVDLLISDVLMTEKNGYELAKLARKFNPKTEILLTTGYGTDLSRFDLKGLHCHLLHKPYHDLNSVCLLLKHLIHGEDVFEEMDEDSFSENIDNPEITEWTL